MKSRIALFALLAVLLAGAGEMFAEAPGEKVYEPQGAGFRISAPQKWAVRKSDNPVVMLQLDVDANVAAGELRPTFMAIVVDSAPDEQELAAVSRAARKQITKSAPDATFSEDQPTTLDGVKAVQFTFTKSILLDGKKHPYKGLRVYALRHGKLDLLAYFAEPANYAAKLPQAQKVIESFKWTYQKP